MIKEHASKLMAYEDPFYEKSEEILERMMLFERNQIGEKEVDL